MARKTNSNFISRNFRKSLSNLKELKYYFWISFFIFFLITIFGYLFPIFFEEQILKLIENLISKTEGLGTLGLVKFIIVNNTTSAFLGMVLGIFLGIFPVSVIIINGYVLGFVASKTVAIEGFSILWRLLPHGIFEIPAILISVALGIKLGYLLMFDCIKYHKRKIKNISILFLMVLSLVFLPISFLIYQALTLTNKELAIKFFNNIKDSIRVFIFIVLPLLIIAGIIEGVLISVLS